MRLYDLFEAPISDIHIGGSLSHNDDLSIDRPFDHPEGMSFSNTDRKILQSPKGREKIIRAFSRTPFDFVVYFINSDVVDGDSRGDNQDVDKVAQSLKAGIHSSAHGVEGEPGKIKVVMLSNLSPMEAKMPMTGWTLAHKIGHSLQDHLLNRPHASSKLNASLRKFYWLLNVIVHYDGRVGEEPPKRATNFRSTVNFDYVDGLQSRMTMKSVRDDKLNNSFEAFAELIAQYLITGKITLKLRKNNPKSVAALEMLNKTIFEMFKSLEGQVLVEV